MAKYPWGSLKYTTKRKIWLTENELSHAFDAYRAQAVKLGMSGSEASEWASDKILEDWKLAKDKNKGIKAHVPVREDWYWAFEHYGDDPKKLKRSDAPSPFAWSLLAGAWNNDTSWKSLQDKVAKELFGDNVGDDDDRAFIATGMPSALRERFSGILGEAKLLFAGRLPEVFGRTERS